MAIRRACLAFSGAVLLAELASAQPRGGQAPIATSASRSPLEEALVLAGATDYANAETALAKISGSDRPRADLVLARLHEERGRFAAALAILGKLEAAGGPLALLAKVQHARVLAARGDVPKAIELLKPDANAKGPEARRLRLQLGELLLRVGRRADADAPLKAITDDYENIDEADAGGLAEVGRAAQLLRSPKDANRAYQESERAAKAGRRGALSPQELIANPTELLLWRGELFLDKYDPGHAEEAAREALAKAPNLAAAHVAMARVKLDQSLDFDAAEAELSAALAVNPECSSAYAVRAGMALRDGEFDKAKAATQKALAINRYDLEAESVAAATLLIAEDKPGYERAKASVLGKNKEYGSFFITVSEFADWEHRYDDIVSMMKEAAKIDPDDGRILATLGLTMLRTGDEKGGLETLQRAWSKDKFNIRVFNTLNLYEKSVPAQYESVRVGPFDFRFPRPEKAMLERYLPTFAGEAVASMKARYGLLPDSPLHIELYGSREHFSVRTSGLPNIGIQGVCFGRVVAALSPESEPFNWGNVIWHELGHVFAIKLSNYRVPRWFTEGLSEYETIVRRPEWQRELDQEFYRALVKNQLPAAVSMNRAFTHAKSAEDVTIAYYASSQLLVYTVESFGMPKVKLALELWGKGKTTPEVLRTAFGLEPAAYDAQFRTWARKRLARYDSQYLFAMPSRPLDEATQKAALAAASAEDHTALAVALLRKKDRAGAEKALQKALELDAKYKDALFVQARLALESKDKGHFQSVTERLFAAGGDGYSLRMLMAEASGGKDEQSLLAAYRYDPSQSEPLAGLLAIAKQKKDAAATRDLLQKLFVLEQHDRKIAGALLDRLVQDSAWEEAVHVGQSALYTDVHSAAIHLGYARALEATGKKPEALFEYESATLGRGAPAVIADAKARLAALRAKP